MRLVVDASVAIKWFAPETLAGEAKRLLDQKHELFAPDFLLIECANIAWKKVRRLFDRTRATPWADRLQWLGALAG